MCLFTDSEDNVIPTEGAAFLSEWSGVAWYFIVIEVVGAILICGGIFFVNSGKSTPAAPARGTDDFDTEKVLLRLMISLSVSTKDF